MKPSIAASKTVTAVAGTRTATVLAPLREDERSAHSGSPTSIHSRFFPSEDTGPLPNRATLQSQHGDLPPTPEAARPCDNAPQTAQTPLSARQMVPVATGPDAPSNSSPRTDTLLSRQRALEEMRTSRSCSSKRKCPNLSGADQSAADTSAKTKTSCDTASEKTHLDALLEARQPNPSQILDSFRCDSSNIKMNHQPTMGGQASSQLECSNTLSPDDTHASLVARLKAVKEARIRRMASKRC